MNLEELQGMSDAELNELAAVKVMGYNMYHYDKDYEENCYFLLLDGIDAVNPLSRGFKTEKEAWRDWNPTNDMNDAMELANKYGSWQLTKLGIGNGNKGYRAIVGKNKNVAHDESPTRAITIASILAKEESD